jgi:hypothetical protein
VPATPVIVVEQALVQLPPQLRQDLLGSFTEIVNNFAENRWEPSELNGGKLCEAAYSICKGLCSGSLPQRAQKPRNMLQACQALVSCWFKAFAVRVGVVHAYPNCCCYRAD